jgi:ATP-binding cassette subfamily B protein
VLLLDEATAVVDGASDATLRTALREHIQPTGTAILTVAHRLSTARDADRVIVLSGGRIAEHGTPAQLLATDSTFAALLAIEEAGWDWEHERELSRNHRSERQCQCPTCSCTTPSEPPTR